ncbi:MAG TPA: PA0069 family radical SAM protein [Steroidobacteraceae bacterium]|nr:PA0069 family radical SAM protein [Steroidobacteraceae bacterium]
MHDDTQVHTGRGAVTNPAGRFELKHVVAVDDGWVHDDEELPPLATTVQADASRSIITRNDSPDISFNQSINPYRGCEHGCIYCFARPSHAYFNLSPGLDFETKLFYKPDAAKLLEAELAKPTYRCQTIAIGTNTDPYQPIERDYKVMRGILEVLHACDHPVSIVTKGSLIERDIDLLAAMAKKKLASVAISVTTLRNDLKRTLEPRTASPAARLRVIKSLSDAGVPVTVMVAPVIPLLTDGELEQILEAAAKAGAKHAGYLIVRLPHEVKQLFRDWLNTHEPLKAKHIMSLLNQMRGGRDNDPRYGTRQTGEGIYAELLAKRFVTVCGRLGLNRGERYSLDTKQFVPPVIEGTQLSLW